MDHPCTLGAVVPVLFIPNQVHVEYELGVLVVWKLSRPERGSNPQHSSCKSRTLIQPPSPQLLTCMHAFFMLDHLKVLVLVYFGFCTAALHLCLSIYRFDFGKDKFGRQMERVRPRGWVGVGGCGVRVRVTYYIWQGVDVRRVRQTFGRGFGFKIMDTKTCSWTICFSFFLKFIYLFIYLFIIYLGAAPELFNMGFKISRGFRFDQITVLNLSIWTDKSQQTVLTQIRVYTVCNFRHIHR